MKKVYNKPEIVFESFSMSTNIAGDCGVIIGNQSSGSCPYIPDRQTEQIFLSTMTGICTTVEEDGKYGEICYHNPDNINDLFNS